MAQPQENFKYWAFISYSHRDELWAKWLHHAMESYRVPRAIVGTESRDGRVPARLFPIFRDRDELPGAADLSEKIKEALRESRYLIVLCSPHSAASQWVDEEIRTFKSMGRLERVLCCIVSGEPNAAAANSSAECFPRAVRFQLDDGGGVTSIVAEPIAADARKGKDGRENAKLKLIAGVLGVGFDALKRREKVRANRRRIKYAAAILVIAVLATLGYIALADLGLPVPLGERIRTELDRHDASFLRPVRSQQDVRAAAHQVRQAIADRIIAEWSRRQWIYESPVRKEGPRTALAVWISSQSLSAVLRSPDSTESQARDSLSAIEAAFSPELLVEHGGVKYGWRPTRSSFTQVEPALWTITAIALALERKGLLQDPQRARYEARLAYSQEAAMAYYPLGDGGWNVFPNQQDPREHSHYSTMLALISLLDTYEAGLPWLGSIERRDQLISSTVQYLIAQYDSQSDPPGWHGAADVPSVSDGLTLQGYAVLLRAHEDTGLALPAEIIAHMQTAITELSSRSADYPNTTLSFSRAFSNEKGQDFDIDPAIELLWHPWAIECASRAIAYETRNGFPPETVFRARRALGHVVVDLKPAMLQRLTSPDTPTFVAAETLHCMASVD